MHMKINFFQFLGGHIDLYAAHRINHIGQLVKIHPDIIPNIHIEILIQGLNGQRSTAPPVGIGDFGLPISFDFHLGVPKNGNQLEFIMLIINGKNHKCIRVSLIVMGAGINAKQGNIGNGFIVSFCAVYAQLTVRFREIPINFDIPHKIPCGTQNAAAENQHN